MVGQEDYQTTGRGVEAEKTSWASQQVDVSASILRMEAPPYVEAPPFSASIVPKFAWHDIDEADLCVLRSMDPVSRRAYETLGKLPGPVRYELGKFRSDQGSTIAFEIIPAFGEFNYSEVGELSGEGSSKEKSESDPPPLLRYLQLTDKNTPVPYMLAEFDDESDSPKVGSILKDREFVDSLDMHGTQNNVGSEMTALAIAEGEATASASLTTCFNGGDDVFAQKYCLGIGISNCLSGQWIELSRHSGWNRRRRSHSVVAACGSAGARVQHFYRQWVWWKAKWDWISIAYPYSNNFMQTVPPGRVYYWKLRSGKKKRRKVWIDNSQSDGAYFRSWIGFYN